MPETGSVADFARRIMGLLPAPWFQNAPPVAGALSETLADPLAYVFSLAAFVAKQTRIQTSTGGFVDLASTDFFGVSLPRLYNEADAAFSSRITAEILRPRGTRAAVVKLLQDVTGYTPTVFEPARTTDTGGYGSIMLGRAGTGLGYGLAGAYGSLGLAFEAFVTCARPSGGGIATCAGYGSLTTIFHAGQGMPGCYATTSWFVPAGTGLAGDAGYDAITDESGDVIVTDDGGTAGAAVAAPVTDEAGDEITDEAGDLLANDVSASASYNPLADEAGDEITDEDGNTIGTEAANVGGQAATTAGAIQYASLSMVVGAITDDIIYARVNAVKPVGTILWLRLTGDAPAAAA